MADKDQKQTSTKGKFALGALIGAAAGAVGGLLFAPKSGEETREDIKNKAKEAEAEVKEKATTAKRKAESAAKEAKATGDRLGKKAKGVAKASKDAVTAETETGSKLKQKEAEVRAKDLKRDVKKTTRKSK